jgi:dienelactone hydrolase
MATRKAAPIRAPRKSARSHSGPLTRRWIEQRWTIDNTIRSVGMDWDQPRSIYLSSPMGVEANADFAGIRQRITKLADASPVFEAVARRREARAQAAEKNGDLVTARDNYFMASIHWGAAQWPIDENDAQNIFYNTRKRDCYTRYAKLADHKIEAVWIAVPGGKIPAWFHLPPGYRGGRIPVVIAVPGMDSFKEISVSLNGDRWLSRGMAVLAIDGPGQYESAVVGVHVTMEAWMATGGACVDWLSKRKEIDTSRIGINGLSFGTFFATIAAAHEPRIRAVAATSVCHEPGFHSIFEEASPTFKMRFMYMSGYTDEAEFDKFRKTLTWEGHSERIRAPYLCLAGEWDELSPLKHTEALMRSLKGRKRLVVYQESRHSVGNVPAANLGPFPPTLVADWMIATLNGKTFPNEKWVVQPSGNIVKTPLK